tara:strand:- start:183 stop:1289 length:1107 start_codon:yes stop_codon:yes gene_type:complete
MTTNLEELLNNKKDSSLSDLINLRSNNIENFSKLAPSDLLNTNTKNSEYWRFLSLHFLRCKNYDDAILACLEHAKSNPNDKEPVDRIFRAELLIDIQLNNGTISDDILKKIITKKTKSKKIENNLHAYQNNFMDEFSTERQNIAALEASANHDKSDAYSPQKLNYEKHLALLKRLKEAKSIAIVGNGSSLLNKGLGEKIDSHDEVIRINFPGMKGHEADIGTRTSLVLTSNQHFTGEENIKNSKNNMTKYPNTTGLILDSAHINSTPIPSIDELTLEKLVSLPQQYRSILHDIGYVFSTTGLSGIIFFGILLRKKVNAFGFDFYSNITSPYYFMTTKHEPTILHEIEYERWLAHKFIPLITNKNTVFF